MEGPSEIDRFQRWLQSQLSEASMIEGEEAKENRLVQIEIAIAEVIRYRQLVNSLNLVASPFVERESKVREPNISEVKPITKSDECHSCGSIRTGDIEFCPVCGEF